MIVARHGITDSQHHLFRVDGATYAGPGGATVPPHRQVDQRAR
ncbi:hypothetical protein M2158_007972 [Streptomyces sp. SAI-144]|nr:hypothetical protein [Streptomyces sp. SAI-144]MDH6439431.1 hypothetical protein [Streptomyces sp. SAI-144]